MIILLVLCPISLILFGVTIGMDFVSRRNEISDSIHPYFSRIIFGLAYVILGIAIVAVFHRQIFYVDQRDGLLFDPGRLNDWPRLLWCGGLSLVGFGFAAIQSRFSKKLPYFPYLFYYPFSLSLITSLSYSVLSLNASTRAHLFYPLSFALCGTLGVLVDKYWEIATALIKK